MTNTPDHFWDFMEDGDLNKFAEHERNLAIAAAALLKLIEYGVPADTREMLVNGSKRAGVRPGALVAALSAALGVHQRS
jgi:hypothetical protein